MTYWETTWKMMTWDEKIKAARRWRRRCHEAEMDVWKQEIKFKKEQALAKRRRKVKFARKRRRRQRR